MVVAPATERARPDQRGCHGTRSSFFQPYDFFAAHMAARGITGGRARAQRHRIRTFSFRLRVIRAIPPPCWVCVTAIGVRSGIRAALFWKGFLAASGQRAILLPSAHLL